MTLTSALMRLGVNPRRAVLLLVLTVPMVPSAQSVDVTITGIVTDPSGAVLRGVTVTATNSQTSLVRSTTSDGLGRYRLPPVPPGEYQLKAELSGFRPHVRDDQMFHVGSTISLDLTLHVLTAAGAVDVVASAPVLETTKNTLSRLVAKEEIDRYMLRVMTSVDVPRAAFVTAANMQHFSGKPWAATAQVSVPQNTQLSLRGFGRVDVLVDVLNLLDDSG